MQFIGLLLLLIGAGIFVLIYGMWLKSQRTERLLRLYEHALDRGLDLQAIRLQFEDDHGSGDPHGNLKAGIFLLAIALAMMAGIWAADNLPGPWHALGFALIPAAAGLAALLIHAA